MNSISPLTRLQSHRSRSSLAFHRAKLGILLALATGPVVDAQLVPPSTAAQLVNLSARAEISAGEPLIAGFVIRGTAPVRLLLRGAGPTLRELGVSSAMANPNLKVFDSTGQLVAANEDWLSTNNTVDLYALSVGAFPFRANSLDAASVVMLPPGAYTLLIAGSTSADAGTVLGEIYGAQEAFAAAGARLVNLSTRARLDSTGSLIGGFVVTGTQTKRFLVRAVGPGLAAFGVSNVVDDPKLEIIDTRGVVVRQNENWEDGGTTATEEIVQAAARVGAFSLARGSRDAAAVATLPPGGYTVRVSGAAAVGRTALLEIYEVEP